MINFNKKFFYYRKDAILQVNIWKKKGLKIGFTSGVFDLLHCGHVEYIAKARRLCDRLVVAVNSDSSVRSYKGIKRPLVKEKDRLRIVAALESVSCAFVFDETNNQENILQLKPDYYFKGGDYRVKDLSSAHHLRSWKGKVKTLPLVKNHSTSNLIDVVLQKYHDEVPKMFTLSVKKTKGRPVPAVFLDRDGVINKEVEYLHDPIDFVLYKGVLAGLKKLQSLGYRLVVVTNQAGIGLGYFSKEDFFKVNKKMLSLCKKNNIIIYKVYYCPHSLQDRCFCRKPRTLLLERAVEESSIDLSRSIMIGDKTSDIKCGHTLGLTTILVKTGHGGKDKEYAVSPNYVARNLQEAALWVEKKLNLKNRKEKTKTMKSQVKATTKLK